MQLDKMIDPEKMKTTSMNSDDMSTVDVEADDKKFVSQAVAFVIGHTRNGFVSLCASVATLLKEQARLKLENDLLRQEIALLKGGQRPDHDIFSPNNTSEAFVPADARLTDLVKAPKLKREDFLRKGYRALQGCICEDCSDGIKGGRNVLTPPVQKGDRVVIVGEMCGSICYVGHVDSMSFPEIFIGVCLDEAVGDTDGKLGTKIYFNVPQGRGLFTPLVNILCLMN